MNININDFKTFIPACQQACNTTSAPNAPVQAAVNPFKTQMTANPFTVTGKEFIPSSEFNQFPLTMSTTYTPFSTTSSNSSEEQDQQSNGKVSADKYKTEMCKNWTVSEECRYGRKCQYAHGKEELAIFRSPCDDKLRTKNCRTFYATKQCMYGSRCMFRHEHRHYNQIMRHYHTAKLYTVESLFQCSKDQATFVNTYESGIRKLSVFD